MEHVSCTMRLVYNQNCFTGCVQCIEQGAPDICSYYVLEVEISKLSWWTTCNIHLGRQMFFVFFFLSQEQTHKVKQSAHWSQVHHAEFSTRNAVV